MIAVKHIKKVLLGSWHAVACLHESVWFGFSSAKLHALAASTCYSQALDPSKVRRVDIRSMLAVVDSFLKPCHWMLKTLAYSFEYAAYAVLQLAMQPKKHVHTRGPVSLGYFMAYL